MNDDTQLIAAFASERSEPAFAELVARHIDLVYATALRAVNGDAHLAQDVTQAVFVALARKAAGLPPGVVLAGWLHRHTCYVAATAVRTERRRKAREQIALEMRELNDSTEPPWQRIAPHLDEGLSRLHPGDRDALVLRFLKQQDFQSVGTALGISDDAAQKRVSRALEKLRRVLSGRGVALPAAALATALAAGPVIAAPAGMTSGIVAASLSAAGQTNITFTLLKLMASTKVQITIACAVIVASVAVPLAVLQNAHAKALQDNAISQQQADALKQLQAEHSRLEHLLAGTPPPAPAVGGPPREVLRLRGEISRLNSELRELAAAKTNQVLSRTEVLDSMRQMYADRVERLKQQFTANPALAVPEIKYLSPDRWLELVSYDHHVIDPDGRNGLSSVRGRAQLEFGMQVLDPALREYLNSNAGHFPTDVSQLIPYFKSPVDEAVLQDWTVLRANALPAQFQETGPWVITQKAPVDAENDQRFVFGAKGIRLGQGGSGSSQWMVSP